MKFVRIADRGVERQLAAALDLAADPDISAVAEEEVMREERAEVDRLLEEVDRELARERATEEFRVSRSLVDARQARQSRRRAERVTLRNALLAGSAPWLLRAGEAEQDGEAAA